MITWDFFFKFFFCYEVFAKQKKTKESSNYYWGVRLVGLPRGGVKDESPFTAVVVVADDKLERFE